jgi:hypothetical protein
MKGRDCSLFLPFNSLFSINFIYYNKNLSTEQETSLSGYENMAKSEIKNYILREITGKRMEYSQIHRKAAPAAALKAANRSKGTKSKPVEIRLRKEEARRSISLKPKLDTI